MKLELKSNKIFFENQGSKKEIHPIWLRERINGDQYLDKKTSQRLFDPSSLSEINIEKAKIDNDILEVKFNDGSNSKYQISKLVSELLNNENLSDNIKLRLWDSSINDVPKFVYKNDLFESKEMVYLLKSFYKFGYVIIKELPTKNNFIINFANSIGNVRATNFGEFFDVKSIPNANDLAYTSLALAPHTDNPYRNPVPCIQLLHCIENEVTGGQSTLVDGFRVATYMQENYPDYFNILTKVKVKFKFVDKNVILENYGQLIELNEYGKIKQVRFSSRLDYVPILEKEELDLYYKARKKISTLYNSERFKIEFKLLPGDLLMMDNFRLLHGRTEYNANEGKRFLQGCYIDYDSSEGKIRHLMRKFKMKNLANQ